MDVIGATFNTCGKLPSVRHLLYKEISIGAITQVENFTNLIGISFTAVLLFGFKMFNCIIISCTVISVLLAVDALNNYKDRGSLVFNVWITPFFNFRFTSVPLLSFIDLDFNPLSYSFFAFLLEVLLEAT